MTEHVNEQDQTNDAQIQKMETIKKVKIISIIVLLILIVIVIWQNAQPAETRILFWSFEISRALLLILTGLFGFVAGMILTTYMYRNRSRQHR